MEVDLPHAKNDVIRPRCRKRAKEVKEESELVSRDENAKTGRRLIENSSLAKKSSSSRSYGGSSGAHLFTILI